MLERKTEERYRWRKEDDVVMGIQFAALPRQCGYAFLDDIWDRDGDSIIVTSEALLRFDGEGFVQATISQGIDPIYAARILRRYADMLEGPMVHQYVAIQPLGLSAIRQQKLQWSRTPSI